jgi:hypothetical protein
MMRIGSIAITSAILLSAAALAARQDAKRLQIYVVDTEGGKAALFVSPAGETALVDSGNPGGRDTDRIMAAIEDAGVKQIDYLISTQDGTFTVTNSRNGFSKTYAARARSRSWLYRSPSGLMGRET